MKIYILTRDLVDEGLAKGRVEFLGCFRTAKEVLDAIMQEQNKENLSYIEKEFEPEPITISRDPNDDLGRITFPQPQTVPLPYTYPKIWYGNNKCRTYDDCTNPQKDCINCPVTGSQASVNYTTTTGYCKNENKGGGK